MTSPGNHILPHYDAALNAIRLRVNAICGSLLKYMDILERVISGPDSDGANSIIADSDRCRKKPGRFSPSAPPYSPSSIRWDAT